MNLFLKRISITDNTLLAQIGYFVVRCTFGVFLVYHGHFKLIALINGEANFDPLGIGSTLTSSLAMFGELVCGWFIAFGFLTRLASIPVLINFIVIVFVVHGKDPFGEKELPSLFLLLAIGTLLGGSGRFSLDRKVGY